MIEKFQVAVRRKLWRDNDLISIILPTRNRLDLLMTRAIPSIWAQTYMNWELLVIDHGGTDGTYSAVSKIGDPRIKAWSIPREVYYPDTPQNRWFTGPVDPLNFGLRHAKGAWIARIDDDDIWTPDSLYLRLATLRRNPTWDFVSAGHETHKGRIEPYDLDGVPVGGCQTWLYKSFLRFMRYDRNCYLKPWDRVNDTDLQRRFRVAGVKMGYIPRIVARVLPRPGETEVGHAAL